MSWYQKVKRTAIIYKYKSIEVTKDTKHMKISQKEKKKGVRTLLENKTDWRKLISQGCR